MRLYTVKEKMGLVLNKACRICGKRFKVGDEVVSQSSINGMTHAKHRDCFVDAHGNKIV